MHQGRGGMGMHKHGATGWKNGKHLKSPKMRMHQKLEAQKAPPKRRRETKMYESVGDAFKNERPR